MVWSVSETGAADDSTRGLFVGADGRIRRWPI